VTRSADDDVLLAAVRAAMAVSVRAADEIGAISPVQLRALTVIQQSPGTNLGRLAGSMQVAMSTASRLVDRLISAGLIDRRPSPQTRREITLSLTDLGRATLEQYDDRRLAALRACVDRLPQGSRGTVIDALRTLVVDDVRTGPAGGRAVPVAGGDGGPTGG
jgi:DNA-binding MarR family transcriptional regulator